MIKNDLSGLMWWLAVLKFAEKEELEKKDRPFPRSEVKQKENG